MSQCICNLTTPCQPHCSCVNRHYSNGCRRCARFGSEEQRRGRAKDLAAIIDAGNELVRLLGVPPEKVRGRVEELLRISDRCEYLGPPECGGAFAQKRDGAWSVYRAPYHITRCGDVFEAERVRGGEPTSR